MIGKEDGVVPEWMTSHLQYLQVILPSEGNPDCGFGFTFISEWGYNPSVELCCRGSEMGKSLQQSSDPEWEKSYYEVIGMFIGWPVTASK